MRQSILWETLSDLPPYELLPSPTPVCICKCSYPYLVLCQHLRIHCLFVWNDQLTVCLLSLGRTNKYWVLLIHMLIPSDKHNACELLGAPIFVDLKCHHFQNLHFSLSLSPAPISNPLPSQFYFSSHSSLPTAQRSLSSSLPFKRCL